MSAGILDLIIEQGATLAKSILIDSVLTDANGIETVTPYDLTNCIARGQMRPSYASDEFVDFECTVDAINGIVTIVLSATATAALKAGQSYVYDIELETIAGVVIRLLQGKIKVTPEATRSNP